MEHISETLEALSDAATAKRAGQHTKSLRGVRGVPNSEIAQIAAAAYAEDRPSLPEHTDELATLFGTAWEDGLVAIGLLSTCAVDNADDALDLAMDWASRIDDVISADALGQLVLAPAVLLTDRGDEVMALTQHRRPEVRRVVAAMALGWTTAVVQGAAAAPLRARVGQQRLRMVDRAFSARISAICDRLLRDDAPPVRKALRRVLRAWADDDPAAVVAWADRLGGGIPKLFQSEIKRARRAHGAS